MADRGKGVPARSPERRLGAPAQTRKPPAESWLGRLANELYLGALVLGVVVVVGAVMAGLVALAMQLSNWVAMVD